MIVRLKKRGEWPHPTGPILNLFRGCCFEVEPVESHIGFIDTSEFRARTGCKEPIFVVTDGRYLALSPPAIDPADGRLAKPSICACYLIDDLEAFDSDFCDEEAKEGDLVFAQVPVGQVKP